jgi:hypothetical protein
MVPFEQITFLWVDRPRKVKKGQQMGMGQKKSGFNQC